MVTKNKRIQRLFDPLMNKYTLLTEPTATNLPEKLDSSNLLTTLENGDSIYWKLERDSEGNITKVKPFSMAEVINNLFILSKVKQDLDVFSDFNSRL